MKKYIVDIYRCEKDKPRSIVGVAEEVGAKGKKAFANFDELWEMLNPGLREESENMSEFQTPSRESRKHVRKNISYFTRYSLDSSSGESVNNGVITNISKSGICLLTPEAINKGENILIKCNINSPARMATVRWSKQYKDCHCSAGLEFADSGRESL